MNEPTPAEAMRAEAQRLLDAADAAERPLTAADLATMTPEEIVKAQNEGRLDTVLKGEH